MISIPWSMENLNAKKIDDRVEHPEVFGIEWKT